MAKTRSKTLSKASSDTSLRDHPQDNGPRKRRAAPVTTGRRDAVSRKDGIRARLAKPVRKFSAWRASRVRLHKSFRRSHREDYARKTETPGLLSHAMATFRTIGQHWKTFLPLILILVVAYIVLVGLMSEEFYQQFGATIDDETGGAIGNFPKAALLLLSTVTTGGLTAGMEDTEIVFMIFLFLILWLITIFLLRHYARGSRPRLRDALYNSLTPLISTLLIFALVFLQAIPMMLVAVSYNAARITGFLSTPFYALLYFIFAALMLLLSFYLFSSSLIALIAVTAPGTYPMTALANASDLMAGRRMRFVLRIIYLFVVVIFIYIIVMLPVILLDLWLKGIWDWLAGVPIVPFMLLTTTCFVFVYATTYLYKYYRYLLDYQEK